MHIQAKIVQIKQSYHCWLHDNLPAIVRVVERESGEIGAALPALVSELARLSRAHAQQEDEVLFPLLSRIESAPPETVRKVGRTALPVLDRMVYDHHLLQDLLGRIRMSADAVGDDGNTSHAIGLLGTIQRHFKQHMWEEDVELYPAVRQLFEEAERGQS